MDRNARFIVRIIGGISLAFGISSAIVGAWLIKQQFAGTTLRVDAAVVVVLFLAISAFCGLVGFRLAFNRPNRNGSILSRTGWRMLTLSFWIVGMTMAAIALGRRDFQLVGVAFGLCVLGLGGVFAARAASTRLTRMRSTVFPAESSLVRMKGFMPAGSFCGIEILNDDKTPMEFVVEVLQKSLGLTKADAIRTMIKIHQKGGALLPMPSFEESERIAELVTAEAQNNHHPLVCRAVRVE